ncbi:MAG: metallophosphoesterase family protein [Thermofilaceae archaeon]
MKESTQLLCLSDLHGKLNAVREFIASIDTVELQAVDAVVIAGDIGDPQDAKTFHHVMAEISKLGKPVFYVKGNWDVNAPTGMLREDPLVADLESIGPVELNGVTLVGHASSLEPIRRSMKRPVVLVTHYPPFSILDRGRKLEAVAAHGSYTGLPEVNYLISYYKPVLHVFGHCHALGGLEVKRGGTLFVNVARLDRLGRDGRNMGNYALITIDRAGNVGVKWRFVNGFWKKCSKCGRVVHLPPDWTLCRRCASRHELSFKQLDKALERVMVNVFNARSGDKIVKEEFFIPISTLRDDEAFEDMIGYLVVRKLKELFSRDGYRILTLSKDKVVEYYSNDTGETSSFSEFLFSCSEEKMGHRICALMKLYRRDRRAKVIWKIKQEGKTIIEEEILLARGEVLHDLDLLKSLESIGFSLLVYSLEKLGGQ